MGNLSAVAQERVNHLFANTAMAYGGAVGQQYSATPSVAQTLNDKIVEDGNWFLQRVNTVPVAEIKGEKVMLGLSGNVASRTDTTGNGERSAKNLVSLDGKGYELFQTDSDVALTYSQIDTWAKFKDFAQRYGGAIRKAIGNDRVKVGFNGTEAAATSSAPDLSDVGVGWLELIRQYNGGAQYLLGSSGSVTLGNETFPNLDSLVFEALSQIEEPFREDPDLVVLMGRGVMNHAKGSYYEAQGNTPSEKTKIEDRMTHATYGGLPAYVPPFFDANSLLVTSFSNLSIYWQEGSWRRKQEDAPKKNQLEDYNSRNEGYVVEQEGKTFLVQGIEYPA